MISKSVFKRTSAICAMAVMGALVSPSATFADEVTLKSSDGTVNIVGDFVGFEDNAYIIRTGLGELRISAERVRCEGSACPVFETASADVVIAGSDTVGLGMMPLLLDGYAGFLDAEATATATSVEGELLAELIGDQGFGDPVGTYLVSSTGSGDAFTKLLTKETEIGMSARRILPAEARQLRDAGAGNMISPQQEHIVAVDSLVVITHPSNPIDTLDKVQLRDIYEGRITNWNQVGGADQPIKVVTRNETSGSRAVFEDVIFLGKDANPRSDAVIVADNSQMATAVNNDAGAIGYVGYAFQRGAKPLTVINHCGMPMTPDAFSAKTEEYALNRRLYFYNRADSLSPAAKDFMEFATSDAADGVITKSGFINLGVERKAQSLDDPRARMLLNAEADAYEGGVIREMMAQMVDYDRLSTTFRFRTGSSKLDERALVDMERLVQYLEQSGGEHKLLIVGFTDDVGAFESNRNLSVSRAEQVKQSLIQYGGERVANVQFEATGFGEVAPAFCNTDDRGRAINRRVEVWISKSAG